jgi:hypothetical protein
MAQPSLVREHLPVLVESFEVAWWNPPTVVYF